MLANDNNNSRIIIFFIFLCSTAKQMSVLEAFDFHFNKVLQDEKLMAGAYKPGEANGQSLDMYLTRL